MIQRRQVEPKSFTFLLFPFVWTLVFRNYILPASDFKRSETDFRDTLSSAIALPSFGTRTKTRDVTNYRWLAANSAKPSSIP